ncbi:hypothetical protein GJ744_008597 [Endocarpon pusillum]|uniref:Uncharacterized protein n=1 Tax=Endocarpon pusillum TaxID=364733 RepID=A0A8H7E5F8_9EURO|nr:hypothetical protein GJ744_008597 [Endocarpon pusillum]
MEFFATLDETGFHINTDFILFKEDFHFKSNSRSPRWIDIECSGFDNLSVCIEPTDGD